MNYRKLRKLLSSPREFFIDALNNKIYGGTRPANKRNPTQNKKTPLLYDIHCGEAATQKINKDSKNYLFTPWITEHTDVLFNTLNNNPDYSIVSLNIFPRIKNPAVRREVNGFAREFPVEYRKTLIHCIAPLANKIDGFLFSFDWSPAMRILANVCEELEIPRILIPHESIFMDRDKYYVDIVGGSSLPIADVVLGWGNLQKEIFLERGYPAERFHIVGSPKLDKYFPYSPLMNKSKFYRIFGLDESKKTILFAAQPLDSQTQSTSDAREIQNEILLELIEYVSKNDIQIIIRMPPSSDKVIDEKVLSSASQSRNIVIDEASCYITPPEEAIFHCDIIASINSTMLLEGAIAGKHCLSINYLKFISPYEDLGIHVAKNKKETYEALDGILSSETSNACKITENDKVAIATQYGYGAFDGQAVSRIENFLSSFDKENHISTQGINSTINRVFNNQKVDVVGIPSNNTVLSSGTQKHLKELINTRKLISTWENKCAYNQVGSVELFLQWGITETTSKNRQKLHASNLSRPVIIIEDGFIRSVDIGLSGTAGLSIIIDDTTAYYDSTKISRLSRIIEENKDISTEQIYRAKKAINKIVENKVSKYNHAPCLPVKIGTEGKKKVLLIDQRFGDQSVTSGLADEFTFEKMLNDAIANHPDCDIIIKQHPDAIKGGKSSYYSDERLAFTKYVDNVYTVNFDINPYCLLDLVEEVYVVTSGMGFEALMAGKKVHCYGMPFYAGWGLTEDQIQLPSRTRKRSLEELFYFSYIEASRYFDPDLDKQVQVEEIVDYIVKHRKW